MASSTYQKRLEELEANAPGEYQSKNQSTIDSLLNQITNKKDFSYDFNADPLYQQYKDQYTKLGNEASMNAVANASALTGGYGSSYAATAGAQANQQYLTELNNIIPSLYNSALQKYQMDNEDLYNQLGALNTQEEMDYTKYRDQNSDYYKNLEYAQNALASERNQENWQSEYDRGVLESDRAYDYQIGRDQVADNQWQQSFDRSNYESDRNYQYQIDRDKVEDNQWQQSFDRSNYESDRAYDYQVNRDQVSDNQWQTAFDYSKERDNVSDAQWQAQIDETIRQADLSHAEWQAEYDEALRQWYYDRGMYPDGTPLYPETASEEPVYDDPYVEEESGNPPQETSTKKDNKKDEPDEKPDEKPDEVEEKKNLSSKNLGDYAMYLKTSTGLSAADIANELAKKGATASQINGVFNAIGIK